VPVGLLDVHVLARQAREDRRDRVPVVGRADHDGVDLRVVDDPPEVPVRDRLLPGALLDRQLGRLEALGVDVADASDVHFLEAGEPVQQVPRPPRDADAADAKPLGRGRLGRRVRGQRRAPRRHGGETDGRLLQELTAVDAGHGDLLIKRGPADAARQRTRRPRDRKGYAAKGKSCRGGSGGEEIES
jgi:hypothetical protein